MELNIAVNDMRVGMSLEGFYVLSRGEVKKASNGKPFLNATLSDCSGKIAAKMWDFYDNLTAEDQGKVVYISGNVSEYAGNLQLMISRFRFATEQDHYNLADLVPCAPIDVHERMEEIWAYIHSMDDADYRAVCETVLKKHEKAFMTIPAAKSVHHGFINGLLMHTSNMLRTASFLADMYDEAIDRNLLLAGTLLHDVMKEEEFAFSELGLVTEYSLKGNLIGHLVMGAQEVAKAAEECGIPEQKSLLLQHMVLSHHGQPEFGAAVKPMCAESELLSLIDQIDAHMEVYTENLRNTPVGEFSGRIFALDKQIYNHG